MSKKEQYFTKVPNVYDQIFASLKAGPQAVLRVIIRHTLGYHRSTCALSLSDIARLAGISRRSTAYHLDTLDRLGIIARSRRQNSTGEYSTTEISLVSPPPILVGEVVVQESKIDLTGVVQNMHGGSATFALGLFEKNILNSALSLNTEERKNERNLPSLSLSHLQDLATVGIVSDSEIAAVIAACRGDMSRIVSAIAIARKAKIKAPSRPVTGLVIAAITNGWTSGESDGIDALVEYLSRVGRDLVAQGVSIEHDRATLSQATEIRLALGHSYHAYRVGPGVCRQVQAQVEKWIQQGVLKSLDVYPSG